ncbi:MAG TPA: hypothetical protein VGN35_05775 [Jatrophihabitantaceae bacterium]|jgi:hypothetical protein|nr:hypothetical protein [Jatrophihabitantaceae bacterium]
MDRLARFMDVTISDPAAFGGGSAHGHVRTRVSTVAYGYLGVVDEYEDADHDVTWCLLTLSLPGLAPNLTVDHRKVFGLPGVPLRETLVATGDPVFDAEYGVIADDPTVVTRILTPALRALLVDRPVQRLSLSGAAMVLRTFDGAALTDDVVVNLNAMVEGILSSTPSFVTPRSGRDVGMHGKPLAPGLCAENEDPPEEEPHKPGFAGRFGGRSRHRV